MSIFKAYDIRGIYGEQLTEELAENIGRAYATYLQAETVVVGRDMRPHSAPLAEALFRGLTAQGVEVTDIGVVSTPMNYFANGTLGVDGSIMITASHNPGEYNGFKMCRRGGLPLSGDEGIKDIEQIICNDNYATAAGGGAVKTADLKEQYWEMLAGFIEFDGKPSITVDYANAMGAVEIDGIKDRFAIQPLFEELDGSFPNHEANPLDPDNMVDVSAAVKEQGTLFGAAFDGDADRCGFVDENGETISMDLITGIIARNVLKRGPANILCDLRSSRSVREDIAANGGTPVMSRVGHAFIKKQMREVGSPFAGEFSGHYYFKENFTTESSGLALIMVANILQESGKTMSELFAPLQKYANTGEINTALSDFDTARAIMEQVAEKYSDGKQYRLDGISTEYPEWWFNLRLSNTEPKLRLIVEADNEDLMAARRDEIKAIIAAGMA